MTRKSLVVLLATLPFSGGLLTGCGIVAEDTRPTVALAGEGRNLWVRRGMLQTANPVLQGRATVTVPTRWAEGDQPDETLSFQGFANLDLSDDAGDAWFPDGNAGRVTAFDLTGFYTFRTEAFDFTAGATNYSLPFGAFFTKSGPRGATNELFTTIGTELLGVRPEFQLHYDYDQADGFYLNFNLSEDFQITEDLGLVLLGGLGYATSGQADWDYGIATSGLADAELRADLNYRIDAAHSVGVNVGYTTIVDQDLPRLQASAARAK